MITVLLARSHPAVRDWVRDALARAPEVEFVADASEVAEAGRLIQLVRWDLVLIACSFLDAMLAEAKDLAWAASEGVRVVALGAPDGDALLHRLWRAGALGCLAEEAAPEAVVEAVRAAARGRPLWTPEQMARAKRWWHEVGCKLEALTQRERQVLELVAEGLSDRQIARRLGIGTRTVQTHVSNILSKLRLEARQQAILFVLKRAN